MAALSLASWTSPETVFPPFVMLCQVFTADFSFCLQRVKSMLRSGDWPWQNISLFYFQKLLGCFCCMFCVMVHLYYEAVPNQLSCIWLNLGREYIPVGVRIHPAASVLCHIISKHQWPSAAGSHAAHAIIHCSTMFHRWRFFGSWVVPSLLHTISFPSFWYRMMLISAVERMLFQKWSGFVTYFFDKV